MSETTSAPLVMAITGASGAVYAARLLQVLLSKKIPLQLTISSSGAEVIRQELGLNVDSNIQSLSGILEYRLPGASWEVFDAEHVQQALSLVQLHHYKNYFTPIASGSFLTRGMVVCPCSGSTLSGIVHASSENLIVRAADVHLKEHRKLVLVPRETPLSVFQIENMLRAAQAGAVVMPAMPGWYHGVESMGDLVDFIVARILDHLGISHNLMNRWGSGAE
ncbi:MAG: UbiX family flavin prenyltransferase [Planctomycetes bacterium]|nr:UbiX family flavin prenyltransferase [Planctomycetota bacterium]